MKRGLLCLVIAVALLIGCGEEVSVPAKKHLKVCSPFEPYSLDPQKISSDVDYKIIQSVFEGLIIPDPETMNPLPGVAERWVVSQDGRVYDFFLRDNATWSDGAPVVADDFVFAANRALSSQFACATVELFFNVKNAKDFFYRKIRDFSKVGIRAVNSRTLRIELEKKSPYFFAILMHPCWSPLNKNVVESLKQYSKSPYPSDAFAMQIICNGPFVPSERVPGICVLLRKNDSYWDADNVLLDKITFSFCANQASNIKRFQQDEISVLEMQAEADDAVKACHENERLIISTFPECFALAFNMANPVFHDRRVRVALSVAINREKLLSNIRKSTGLAAYGFVPAMDNVSANEASFKRDVELAKKLFAEAGYGPSKEFPKVRILCNTLDNDADILILEQVVDDWHEAFGIDCIIEPKDLDYFLDWRRRSKFDIVKILYGGTYCDPVLMIGAFVSWETKNYGRWDDHSYDDIVTSIDQVYDELARLQLIGEAKKYLAAEMPIIPLFFKSSSYLLKKDVRGWFKNPLNMHPTKFVYFVKP
ncbi:MAG: peptide ABC transporter substrate-binding protein [Puniceicoccales bacterium]|jgi:oligopeptide transport system substrate-binding protein|nr:peptide ABC transporter substrate-binding protein [Puniceicoccales bacterium]